MSNEVSAERALSGSKFGKWTEKTESPTWGGPPTLSSQMRNKGLAYLVTSDSERLLRLKRGRGWALPHK